MQPVLDCLQLKPRSSSWELQWLRTLAYNFVQLESGFDQLMPKSRRQDVNNYCASNASKMKSAYGSKTAGLNAIKAAQSLCD